MATALDFIRMVDSSAEPFLDFESRKIRAVVVDDSEDYMEVVCALVEMEEEVEVIGRATNGADGIEAVGRLSPDLVIMDVRMPLMDGISAASLIRKHYPEVEIILMSSESFPEVRCAGMAAGASAFIPKIHFREQFLNVFHTLFETC